MSNIQNQIHHYTFALYSIYEEEENKSFFVDQLNILFNSLYSEKEIIDILASNNIPINERKKIVNNIYENNMHEYLINFLYILIDNNFIHNVLLIIQDFFTYYNNENNIVFVQIFTAYEMKEKDIDKILDFIRKKINKEISHVVNIDKSLIGGFKVIYDEDHILDFSIKGKINNLKLQITNSKGDD